MYDFFKYHLIYFLFCNKIDKVNRKVQEEPRAEAAANPRHQEEEKKWHKTMIYIYIVEITLKK